MSNRRYLKPTVTRVDLRPEEAVLNGCKIDGYTGWEDFPGASGHCIEVRDRTTGRLIGYGTCQTPGS